MPTQDLSMYSSVLADPPSPMDTANKLLGVANEVQQNRLLQGTVQPKIDTARLQLAQQQLSGLRSQLGALAGNPNPTTNDLDEIGKTGIAEGWFTPDQYNAEKSSWPGDSAPASARQAWVMSHYVRNLDAEKQIALQLGSPMVLDNGQTKSVVYASPTGGVRAAPGGTMRNLMPPAAANQPVDGPPGVNGEKTVMPAGAFAEATGQVPPGTYMQGGAGMAPMRGVIPPRQNVAPAAGAAGVQPQATAPQATQPVSPVMTTGLPVGSEDAMKNSATAYQSFRNDVGGPQGAAQRIYALQSALSALDGTTTGLGTQGRQRIVSYLNALPQGIGKWLPGVDPQKISDYDLARKFLNAYALNSPGANRSDAGLSATQSANANVDISQDAARHIAVSNIGLERMRQAQVADFEKSGAPPAQWSAAASKWNQTMDPRAFSVDLMSAPDRAKYIGSLSKDGQKKFLDSVRMGIKTGVIDKSALAGGQ